MLRLGSGVPVPSWRDPRLQPLCRGHFNLPFLSLPKGFLVPGQVSRKTVHYHMGTQPFPQLSLPLPPVPSSGPRVTPSPLGSSLTHSQAPVLFPFLRANLKGRLEEQGHRLDLKLLASSLSIPPPAFHSCRGGTLAPDETAFPLGSTASQAGMCWRIPHVRA